MDWWGYHYQGISIVLLSSTISLCTLHIPSHDLTILYICDEITSVQNDNCLIQTYLHGWVTQVYAIVQDVPTAFARSGHIVP